jgi:hypothetical protein
MADLEGGDNIPKASIGNYKGVMLCNRPNEFGQVQKPERQGKPPFISRVDPKEKVGLNPTKKIINVPQKKKDANSILVRHKRYLKMLQEKKLIEKLERENEDNQKVETLKKFKEHTAKQRQKITTLKTDKIEELPIQIAKQKEDPMETAVEEEKKVVKKLTKENLFKNEEQYSKKAASRKGNKKKPAWAKTEEMLKKEQEEEIDDLIEFAYDLDYEKYVEDLEVRQALALIKERVEEIKQDNEWRQKLANEWNQEANPNEGGQRQRDDDAQSAVSIRTSVTGRSRMSKKSEFRDEIQREERQKEEWDASTQGEKRKPTLEEKLASKLADQILEDNPKLKGIHSKVSMKKMLEKEAAKQFNGADGGAYDPPKISTVKDHEMRTDIQASNLPYLHKNPAI